MDSNNTTDLTRDTARQGRLANPGMNLGSDPRSDPRMLAAIIPFGLHQNDVPGPLTQASPLQEKLDHVLQVAEPGNWVLFDGLVADLPPVDGVERSTQVIPGPDGNQITLYISRPAGASGALPGALQIHGGAMVFLDAAGSVYARWRDELAAVGMVAIAVEYRTAGGKLGDHPFPAGLTDCVAALDWVHRHRPELGLSSLVLTGDSGGANLALATALKANRDGNREQLDGVYALAPYISGAAAWDQARRAAELPSWPETDGYFYCAGNTELYVSLYDPDGAHAADPLAWPYFAEDADLRGLPPHVISVNELDPVRDEGLAYYRKLLHAGVDATAVTLHGVCHVADLMLRAQMPELYAATIAHLKSFAEHVAPPAGAPTSVSAGDHSAERRS